jgi:hypothetical protein
VFRRENTRDLRNPRDCIHAPPQIVGDGRVVR